MKTFKVKDWKALRNLINELHDKCFHGNINISWHNGNPVFVKLEQTIKFDKADSDSVVLESKTTE